MIRFKGCGLQYTSSSTCSAVSLFYLVLYHYFLYLFLFYVSAVARGIMLPGRPSVRPLTPISHDAIAVYLAEVSQ